MPPPAPAHFDEVTAAVERPDELSGFPGPEEELPETLVMGATPAAPPDTDTVPVATQVPPLPGPSPAAAVEGAAGPTIMMPAAVVEKTVQMASPASPAPVPRRSVAQAVAAAVRATPPPAAGAEEPPPVPPTVLMPAPALGKAAPATTVPPPPARPAPRPAAAVQTAPIPASMGPAGAARLGTGRTLLLAGGAAAVLLVVAVAGAFVLLKGSDDVAATQPSPTFPPRVAPARRATRPTPEPTVVAPSTGLLRIATQPPGATVTVNGEARGATPLEVGGLAFGGHEVKVDLRGFTSAVQKVVLTAEAPQADVNVALTRTTPSTSMAEMLSSPAGALVRIDGIAVGQTPLRHPLRSGSHTVEMAKEGYETWSGTVEVQGRGTPRVDAQLRSLAPATPTPEPVDVARVYTSGEVDTQPRRVAGGSAPYPQGAPRLRPGRDVTVAGTFVVDEDGQITELKINESAGEVVDEAVMAAVRNWKYVPGERRGVKVKVRVAFKQTFRAG
jgi:TonB family protein